MSVPVPTFNPAPYAHLYAHEWAIDLRHAQVLFAVCAWLRPQVVVEIGSFEGASTAAFVEAVNAGFVQELHCFEVNPPAELERTLGRMDLMRGDAARRWFTLYRQPLYRGTWRATHRACFRRLVFIDGNHGAEAIEDLAPFLSQSFECIALHDTNPHAPLARECWGAVEIGRRLNAPNVPYDMAHDEAHRAGERTERGLTIGFRCNDALADRTQVLMDRRAPWWTDPNPPPAAA